MSRWECSAGHVFKGNFFGAPTDDIPSTTRQLSRFACPACGEVMILSGGEGAFELLNHIREFVGQVSRDPQHAKDGLIALTAVGQLETSIKKLAEEAARP